MTTITTFANNSQASLFDIPQRFLTFYYAVESYLVELGRESEPDFVRSVAIDLGFDLATIAPRYSWLEQYFSRQAHISNEQEQSEQDTNLINCLVYHLYARNGQGQAQKAWLDFLELVEQERLRLEEVERQEQERYAKKTKRIDEHYSRHYVGFSVLAARRYFLTYFSYLRNAWYCIPDKLNFDAFACYYLTDRLLQDCEPGAVAAIRLLTLIEFLRGHAIYQLTPRQCWKLAKYFFLRASISTDYDYNAYIEQAHSINQKPVWKF